MNKHLFLFFIVFAVFLLFGCNKTQEQEISVESISLGQTTAEMIIGETVQLTATVLPSNATDKTIIWASSKQSVATITNSGLITAISEGTSTITVSAGGKSATCIVTVSKGFVAVNSILLNKTELALNKGQSETLTATVKPDDATDKTVTWTSSDTKIATVDSNGKVTALAGGTATITAKAGDKQTTCAVTVSVPVESVVIDKESISLEEGDYATLVATVKPDDATDKSVTWSSSNTSIASVDQNGKVTAVKEGKTTITAKAGEKTATCNVTVQKKIIAVTSVTLNKTSLALNKGQSETLTATVKPDDATDKTVTWTSSDTKIATVDSNGKVTALAGGTATITAKAGDKQTTCAVTVSVPVESVVIDKESISLEEGDYATLVATVKPDDATDKSVTWSSSNTSIASVDQNGKVTAVKEGKTTITAKAGEKTATCNVTVQKKIIAVTSVTLNKTSLALNKGQSETLTATVKPNDATDKTVTWTSSDTKIATVDSNGKVTALAGGTATITAKAGDKQTTCAVTVSVPVESVVIDKESISLEEGDYATLVATVKPDDATDKSVTWSSSDTKVATVDPNGKVTAVAGGSATISAKAGDKQATCAVTVSVPVESVVIDKESISLEEGDYATLVATVKPDDATDKSVTWSSSNTSIASVDQNGKVTAVKEGKTTITAKAGEKTATCNVTVQKKIIAVTSVTLNKTSLALNKGQSETLTATVKPDDATDKTVTWTSSDTKIATVDSNGKVTALAGGTATITAKAGDKQATCTVTVSVPVESITLDRTSLTLIKGESATLYVTISPNDVTDKTVTWSSTNTAVATVDSNGNVKAVAGGSAIISAKAGDKQATCSVTVISADHNSPVIKSFTFSPESIDVTDSSKDVKVSIHVTDESGIDESRLPSVTIYLQSNPDLNKVVKKLSRESGTNKDGVYSVTITIPQGKTPGDWTVYSTVFYDIFGNSSAAYTHSCNKKLIVINNSSSDLKGPVLESFTFSPESIDVTDSSKDVKVSIHVTDESGIDDSQLPSVTIYLQSDPDGNKVVKKLSRESGTNKDGVYSVTITIPQGKTPGDWTVYSTVFYDIFGNSSAAYTHSCNKKLIVINNSSSDLKGPVLESFTFSPESIDVTDSSKDVKVSIHVTDESGIDESRLPSVTIYLQSNPDLNKVVKKLSRESGTNKDGVYSVTITIPQGKTPGNWTVYSTVFYDIFGNSSAAYTHSCNKKLIVISN